MLSRKFFAPDLHAAVRQRNTIGFRNHFAIEFQLSGQPRTHELYTMTHLLDFARPVVCVAAGFQARSARRQLAQELEWAIADQPRVRTVTPTAGVNGVHPPEEVLPSVPGGRSI